MYICLRCNKFLACNKADEKIQDCIDYEKRDSEKRINK